MRDLELLGSSRLLGIYLNDHWAGSLGGLELARRSAASNAGTELGAYLRELIAELEAERTSLAAIMDDLGVRRDPTKSGAAWTAEKLGRLKPNGQLRGYSPLSRLTELEALTVGARGKLSMWECVGRSLGVRLRSHDLEGLIEQAVAQLEVLGEHRLQVAAELFADER